MLIGSSGGCAEICQSWPIMGHTTFQEEGCLRLEEDMTEDDLKSMAASCIEKLDSTVEQ